MEDTVADTLVLEDSGVITDVHYSQEKGVSKLWSSVNHIAIIVSDVGRSLQFYTDVVGMKQILRPDFDR